MKVVLLSSLGPESNQEIEAVCLVSVEGYTLHLELMNGHIAQIDLSKILGFVTMKGE